jgi:hypothetical protein
MLSVLVPEKWESQVTRPNFFNSHCSHCVMCNEKCVFKDAFIFIPYFHVNQKINPVEN